MTPIPQQIAKFRALINGYKISQIVMSLESLGVFQVIGDGKNDISMIAEKIGVNCTRLEPLLNAVVNYGLLSKDGGEYSFTEDSVVLNPKHPASQNGYIRFSQNVRDKWTKLSELVKETELGDLGKVTGANPEQTRNFISAMHVNALPQAKFVVENFNFEKRRVLDLGGGSGVYTIEVGKRFPSSTGVIFDLPGVIPITNEYVEKENVSNRFDCKGGDYHKEFPAGKYDDIFLFAVAHQESREQLADLLREVREHLNEKGRIFLTSFFLEKNMTEPTFPALFSVEMIVMHEQGHVYTFPEIEELLSTAGFEFERIDSVPGPATLYVGK
jgi:SAM-dependent methyltransferase